MIQQIKNGMDECNGFDSQPNGESLPCKPDVDEVENDFKPLSRQFLLERGYCCNNGCVNCPY